MRLELGEEEEGREQITETVVQLPYHSRTWRDFLNSEEAHDLFAFLKDEFGYYMKNGFC